jgi:methyl-accepting chemotaxis protein
MYWKNIKIFNKLLFSSIVILVFSIIIGLIGVSSLNKINDNTSEIAEYYLPVVNNSYKIDKHWHEVIDYLDNYHYSGNSYFRDKVLNHKEQTLFAIQKVNENAELAGLSEENKQKLAIVKSQVESFSTVFDNYKNEVEKSAAIIKNFNNSKDQIISRLKENNSGIGLQKDIFELAHFVNEIRVNRLPKKFSDLDPIIQNLRNSSANAPEVQELIQYAQEYKDIYVQARQLELNTIEISNNILADVKGITEVLLDSFTENAEITNQITESSTVYLLLILLAVVILGILFSYFISRSITEPLKESVQLASAIANGNLTKKLKIKREDEVGMLVTALNQINSNISKVIKNIKESADQISSAGSQLSSSAQDLANGANEQAASTEEMAASIEEMSTTVKQNSENAQTTGKIAKNSANEIIVGTKSAQEAIISMNEIADKVQIIGEIAFQTNLLALNAAVEAARAGDAGRGFSVVAAEVRKLAERSKLAAIEIERVSGKTVTVSTDAGNKLGSVAPEIEKTAQLIEEIAISSMEQINGIGQISGAVDQLNAVTQKNVSSSEQVASNAEQLLAQSEHLVQAINFFQTDEESTEFLNIAKTKLNQPEVLPVLSSKGDDIKIEKTEKKENKKTVDGFNYNLLDSENKDDEFEKF